MESRIKVGNGGLVAEELEKIASQYNGLLNPRQVVEAASDPDHALHPYFEWDDGEAADAYRLAQARALIRRVKITVVRKDEATRKVTMTVVRGRQSRPSMRNAEGGYEAIDDIISDTMKREEMLASVLAELQSYRRRYDSLVELKAVWHAIDDATGAQKKPVGRVTKSKVRGRATVKG